MKRSEAIEYFVKQRKNEIVIAGVGNTHSELYHLGHQDTNLYSVQLGYPLPVGLGLALALPSERVVVMEGDGSILLDIGVLTTIANHGVKNLTSIIFDNGAYEGGGSDRSATSGKTNLAQMAKGAGIVNAFEVSSIQEFEPILREALSSSDYYFIAAKVEYSKKSYPPLPFDKTTNAVLFQRALALKGITRGYHTAVTRHYDLA